MKETIQDMAHQLFFDICQKEPTDFDVFFLDHINFPKIDYEPRMTVYLPTPRETQGMQVIQGNVFSNLESSQETIFALFFASVCHAAGHAKITDFKKYKDWMNGKNKKRAYETFEFIEDIRVNDFLRNEFPEYYSEIIKIKEFFNTINEKTDLKDFKKYSKKVFADRFVKNIKKERNELKEKILHLHQNDDESFIQIADIVYNSSNIMPEQRLPFEEHFSHPKKIKNWNENISLSIDGRFQSIVDRFSEIWFGQLKRRAKIKKNFKGMTEDLEFDNIDFSPENLGEYLRLRNATHLFLKKMSSQIKMTPNSMDDSMAEDRGLLEMQAAIQSVAAQNNAVQIFEQDDASRVEEEWAILVDTSSSMRLKFDEMKKFTMCLGEAANDVNSQSGKWGLYTFNNNFSIVKDLQDKYDQTSKSRVGGIEVQGLSFIADAVTLTSRILEKGITERKYIFLITDGQALGTAEADKNMKEAIMSARKKGISIIAIGVPQGNSKIHSKIYSMCMPYEGLKKTIAKFVRAYTIIADQEV